MNEQAAKPAAPTIDFPAQVSEQAMGRVLLEGKCLNGAIVNVLNRDGSGLATAWVVGGTGVESDVSAMIEFQVV